MPIGSSRAPAVSQSHARQIIGYLSSRCAVGIWTTANSLSFWRRSLASLSAASEPSAEHVWESSDMRVIAAHDTGCHSPEARPIGTTLKASTIGRRRSSACGSTGFQVSPHFLPLSPDRGQPGAGLDNYRWDIPPVTAGLQTTNVWEISPVKQ